MKHPVIQLVVLVDNVVDEMREYPIKDANGVPTDKTIKRRVVSASGFVNSIDGKRQVNIALNWFDPPSSADIPKEDKEYKLCAFRSITLERSGGYTVQM